MKTFQIEREEEDDSLTLRLIGDIDTCTFSTWELALAAAVEAKPLFLTIDCRRLNSINSTALGLLMAGVRQIRQQGGRVNIHNLSPALTRIFNQLGFSRLTDDDGEALAGAARS